jgi:hypothetical protein
MTTMGTQAPDLVAVKRRQQRTWTSEEFLAFFRANYGSVHQAFAALDEAGRERLGDGLVALARRHDRAPGGRWRCRRSTSRRS